MASRTESPIYKYFPCVPLNFYKIIVILTVTASLMISAIGHADTNWSALKDGISIESVLPSKNGGYGYKLQYYVPVPIKAPGNNKINNFLTGLYKPKRIRSPWTLIR